MNIWLRQAELTALYQLTRDKLASDSSDELLKLWERIDVVRRNVLLSDHLDAVGGYCKYCGLTLGFDDEHLVKVHLDQLVDNVQEFCLRIGLLKELYILVGHAEGSNENRRLYERLKDIIGTAEVRQKRIFEIVLNMSGTDITSLFYHRPSPRSPWVCRLCEEGPDARMETRKQHILKHHLEQIDLDEPVSAATM